MRFSRMAATYIPLVMLGAITLAVRPVAAQTFDGAGNAYFSTNGNYTVNYYVGGTMSVGSDINQNTSDANGPFNPTVNIVTGGVGNGGLASYNSSTVNVSSGTVSGYSDAYNTSKISVIGGTVNALIANNSSTVIVSSGAVKNLLGAANTSTVTVSGGTVSGFIQANDSSTMTFTGVTAGEGLSAYQTSTVLVRGGKFALYQGYNFVDGTKGAFTFFGTGLSAVRTGTGLFGGTDYLLSGTLTNGDSLTGDTINVETGAAMFTLVNAAPEPSQTAALGLGVLGIAGLALKAHRRKPLA